MTRQIKRNLERTWLKKELKTRGYTMGQIKKALKEFHIDGERVKPTLTNIVKMLAPEKE